MADQTHPIANEAPLNPPIEASANPIMASTEAASNPAADPVTAAAAAEAKDISMADAPSAEQPASPALPAPAASATPAPNNIGSSPAPPARTGTPLRNHQEASALSSTSRAASAHPQEGGAQPTPLSMPSEAPPHGGPVRQYLNSKVTGALLDGMKVIARDQPSDPLRVLGEYLIQRSRELEPQS